MRKSLVGMVGLGLAATLTVSGLSLAVAAPPAEPTPTPAPVAKAATLDDRPSPQETKRRALRERALRMVLNGQSKVQTINGSRVVKVGSREAPLTRAEQTRVRNGKVLKSRKIDQYVELSREQTDKIFVVLTEFGNERGTDIDPRYGDIDTDPNTAGPTVFDGPLHNKIPEPDRAVDNSTVWQADYSADYFRNLYFGTGPGVESLKTYYEKQSSGRYSVDGLVTDWVKVKYNEARYGRSNGFPCGGIVCSNTDALLKEAIGLWVADQQAKGQTVAQITATLKSYDQWDRNDFDGDGNFNEPDGYLDHFQIVHAGGDQADGDPQQGEDAIWSHRGNSQFDVPDGPPNNENGGFEIADTGVWVSDYTVQPENGGLSVFTHEYGHDLGLPDLYDTVGGANAVGWWSLMAQSRLSAKGDVGIGTRPGDLGAWEKLQLGWLDYELIRAGDSRTYKLGPHEYNSKNAQGLVVVLPKKRVTEKMADPYEGQRSWWSGTGDSIDHTMTRNVTLPAGSAQLSFQAQYDIEDCGPDPCDYAYVQVNEGGGWVSIPGNITEPAERNGIDGITKGWVPATFDLSAYAGKTIGLRFRYRTDGAAQGNDPDRQHGLFIDDLSITAGGTTLLSDGAENPPNGWTLRSFTSVPASVTTDYDNYYVASYRAYVSYDKYLKSGPYNFGYLSTRPDWMEHFPYQNGLLVSYWDSSQTNNNVSQHPGAGLILPIDANPNPLYRLDGRVWPAAINAYDAPFGRERSDTLRLHTNGRLEHLRGQDAQPLFDDTRTYWYATAPLNSVRTAARGVTLEVTKQTKTSMTVEVGTSPTTSASALRSATSGR